LHFAFLKMRTLPEIKDPGLRSTAQPGWWLERWLVGWLNDPRDLPFVRLCLYVQVVLMPLAVALFWPVWEGWVWWLMAVVYFAAWAPATFSFMLMLHDTSHNPLFKRQAGWANYLIPWYFGWVFGQAPGTFFLHHIGMHHAENNQWRDLSSTMPYQRDSLWDFLRYVTRFLLVGIPEAAWYFWQKGRTTWAVKMLAGELLFFVVALLLWQINAQATLVLLLLPYVFVRFSLMAGNWAQHAFVDPSDPGNPYLNCVTCLNTWYNRLCYNDGYHIGHHYSPHRHWTQMPADFLKNLDRYTAHRALVFDGLNYFHLWFFLMTRQYGRLSARLVNLNGMFADEQAAIDLLRQRTQKFQKAHLTTSELAN
jgi:fatty acid desaturase